ncbi:Gfo/Idh/MocA family oxidoreductase [Conexibacter sp. DBS9H8]|uniref:Gfo/Idh/MocA family protein n=1 Tax=Conexibacter sp. DBS9H8 TaxID=2937801 RepID=UPI00200FF2AE|nr:Gfo/Idh/MocA family oxidoreductase [Conexibacter sp. DBS9H8]
MDLRVALAGYGLAGRVFHAPLIATTPGLSLAHILTTDPERVAKARAEHPEAEVRDSLGGGWETTDLLVVATPNATHVPLAEAAIARGIAVVVDKPLAPDARSAARLVARAAESAVPLSVFHNRRWDAEMLTAAELVREGRLGTVRRWESRIERWRPDGSAGGWRARPPEAGGGLLLDLASHLVDQALRLFGPVAAVYAESATVRPGHAAEDDAFLALTHAGGVVSHLHVSAVCPAPGPRLRVIGTTGAYVVAAIDGQEDALRAGRRPGDGAPWGEVAEPGWGHIIRGDAIEPVPSRPGDWPAFYAQMAAAVRDGAPVPVDPADAVTGLEVLAAARESATRRAVVTLGA